ncbi:MAG: L,D-transpeptidase family protein [Desulfovibrio sp.]
MKGLTPSALLLILILLAGSARAEGWNPIFSSHDQGPELMVAVDKTSQTLYVLGRHSPLEVLKKLPCTTGQSDGDKVERGDLRTPEGVYFIEGRLDRGLDWELYGDVAYPLNYPNPVDRIRGKSGSGIWLHGRGKQLVPRDTRGCVALADPDIHALGQELHTDMPVVIAGKVAWTETPGEDAEVAAELTQEVRAWAKDWSDRSERFFTHYAPESLTDSGIEFNGFRAHKRNIFQSQPWIEVLVDNIRALQGPGYWVTWFDQYYRTGSLTSTVGKRLYWQRDNAGKWRIVGREIASASEDLTDKYLATKSAEVSGLIHSWAEAWQRADLAGYASFYAKNAVQDSRRGSEDIAAYKATLWAERPPSRVGVDNIEIRPHNMGLVASFIQTYRDASGYEDKGRKTLILAPSPEGWRIVNEQWRAL